MTADYLETNNNLSKIKKLVMIGPKTTRHLKLYAAQAFTQWWQ
jgi:hypothetical protein